MAKGMNNRGQIAIWVIIAIVLVVSILLFLLLYEKKVPILPTDNTPEFTPATFLQQCTNEHVTEITDSMIAQGGFIQPINFLMFNGTKATVLCENVDYYSPCIHQHPVLLQEVKQQIDDYLTDKLSSCFFELEQEINRRNGKIIMTAGSPDVDVSLGDEVISVHIDKKLTITNNDQTQTVEEFDFDIDNPIYNLAVIANEIASQEAKYCNFEPAGFSLTYPKYTIRKYSFANQARVYTIYDEKHDKLMNIAVRSCAIPPGV